MVPSIFIVDQKILQSDWMRDTTGHIQPQSSSLRGYFPLIFSTDIDDQRILQSNLMTSTTGHIQSKHAPFLHDYIRAKNWLIPSREINDPRILQSDWIRGRIDQPPPPQKGSLKCCLSLMTNSCKKTKVPLEPFLRYWWSKILQSDWTRGTTVHNQPKR